MAIEDPARVVAVVLTVAAVAEIVVGLLLMAADIAARAATGLLAADAAVKMQFS